jgi:hypothetical protein
VAATPAAGQVAVGEDGGCEVPGDLEDLDEPRVRRRVLDDTEDDGGRG